MYYTAFVRIDARRTVYVRVCARVMRYAREQGTDYEHKCTSVCLRLCARWRDKLTSQLNKPGTALPRFTCNSFIFEKPVHCSIMIIMYYRGFNDSGGRARTAHVTNMRVLAWRPYCDDPGLDAVSRSHSTCGAVRCGAMLWMEIICARMRK